MEIQVDEHERVYVRWHDRDPFTVLDRHGQVSEQFRGRGVTVWESSDVADSIWRAARKADAQTPSAGAVPSPTAAAGSDA